MKWSNDHLAAIARIEECVRNGGLYALAMPRGSGKTELNKRAVEWAILGGYRRFALLVGATDPDAGRMMADIKRSFDSNPLLAADFPEVCFPIWSLRRIHNRAAGQTLNGKPTDIVWRSDEIRMPTVEGSHASGAAIWTRGITGAIRGANTTSADGGSMRPDFAIVDDPQTRDSAKSIQQTTDRELTVEGDVVETAGPNTAIACVMICTVIYPNDLSERFLDRKRHPSWHGEKFKALYALPENLKLWEKYADIRADSHRAGGDGSPATEFYKANRAAMDYGAIVSWEERIKPGDISALQTAMNMRADKPRTFAAEWQNEPVIDRDATDLDQLDAVVVAAKLNNARRGDVPRECSRITGFIDVQSNILFWAVCAWTEKFSGAVIDYGCFPQQNRDYFAAADANPTLQQTFAGMPETAAIFAGLNKLVPTLLNHDFVQVDTGARIRIERLLIDSGYQADTIHQFCRQSPHTATLYPSRGYGIGASKVPVSEWPMKPNERAGLNWRLSAPEMGRGRTVKVDTNLWKTFTADRLRAPMASPGCLSLFGSDPREHRLFADHVTAEYRIRTEGRGRVLEEWLVRPDRRENHWWDGLIGCAVAASVQGIVFDSAAAAGIQSEPKEKPKLIDIGELYRKAKGM